MSGVPVRSGSDASWPAWLTMREARFLTGLDDGHLLELVRTGAVGTDHALEGLGDSLVLVRSIDLQHLGLLGGEAWPDSEPEEPEEREEQEEQEAATEPAGGDGTEEVRAELADLAESPRSEEIPVEFAARTGDAAEASADEVALHADWRSFYVTLAPDAAVAGGAIGPAPPRRRARVPIAPLAKGSRWMAGVAGWAALGWLAGLVLALVLPLAAGYRPMVVHTGSMSPTLSSGDVVLDRSIVASEVKVGDLVAFDDPADPARTLVRRAREVDVEGSTVRFVTKGDADRGIERWSVPADRKIGQVAFVVPALGRLASAAGSVWGLSLLIGSAAVAGGLWVLRHSSRT